MRDTHDIVPNEVFLSRHVQVRAFAGELGELVQYDEALQDFFAVNRKMVHRRTITHTHEHT